LFRLAASVTLNKARGIEPRLGAKMREAAADRGTRYKAFISYSHKDAAVGRWLHRRLETYRIPRRLAGTEGLHGPVPARLLPIFRDREELPAAGDLSETVRAALAASENLIIVCSPNAAASPWVGREIALFRELHPGRPVYAAIIEGEPAEAFPAELTAGGTIEPLAADLRGEGDGRRLGFLKLAAGLAGVGLDALVQRDAQRRIRRVMAVTGAAVAAMLVMAVLTTMALTARAEAERQRAEAEGLVEFMLTDLRDRLRGVGRLDVLTAVNERALAHYQRQGLDTLEPDALERRARLLHAMGEDDEKRDFDARALAQFQEAARTTAALLARDPGNSGRIYAHAQSEYWVGLIAWRQNRIAKAQEAFEAYAQLAGRLIVRDPRNPEWLMEAGYAKSNLGTLMLRGLGDHDRSLAAFDSALAYFNAASGLRPGDPAIRADVADAHAWIADAHRAGGRLDRAVQHRKAERTILGALRKLDPLNRTYAQDHVGNALGLALLELDLGKGTAATVRLEQCLDEVDELLSFEPSDERTQGQRRLAQLLLAKALMLTKAPPRALNRARRLVGACLDRDAELRQFCQLIRTRHAAQGTSARLQRRSPGDISAAGTQTRLSPRWGLDLHREKSELVATANSRSAS
jgi:tetratricopeptide (TPR) repeat protein